MINKIILNIKMIHKLYPLLISNIINHSYLIIIEALLKEIHGLKIEAVLN
jgi:hypothetical protein